jgi:hypothetical protein
LNIQARGEQRIELVEDFVGLLALPTRGTVGYYEDGSRRRPRGSTPGIGIVWSFVP